VGIDAFEIITYANTLYSYPETEYKIKGLVSLVTDPDSNVTSYEYETDTCYLSKVRNPEGGETSYTYDVVGRITSETSPMGFVTRYAYSNSDINNLNKSSENISKIVIVDNNANINTELKNEYKDKAIKTVYDGYGNKIQEIAPNQYVKSGNDSDKGIKYTYYNTGRLKTATIILTDELGAKVKEYITEYIYDNAGNKKTEKKYEKSLGDSELKDCQEKIYEYDNMDRLYRVSLKTEDMSFPVVLEEYDYETKVNLSNSLLLDDVKIHKVFYDADANPQKCIITKVVNDYNNKTETTIETGKASVKKSYNKIGDLVSQQIGDDTRNTTTFAYDGFGRVIRKREPIEMKGSNLLTSIKKYKYTSAGNLIEESVGVEKVIKYDDQTKNVDPTNYLTKSYTYNGNGKITQIFIPEGKIKDYRYDNDGNLKQEITYNSSSKSSKVVYRNNHFGKPEYKFEFIDVNDIEGAPSSAVSYAIVTKYDYDASGNVTKVKIKGAEVSESNIQSYSDDSLNPDVEYTYDDLNRLKSVIRKGNILNENVLRISGIYTQMSANIITSTEYNWEGKPVQITDGNQNVTNYKYFYNNSGRVEVVSKEITSGDPVEEQKQATFYDWAGRLKAEVSPKNYKAAGNGEDSGISYINMNHIRYEYSYPDNASLMVEKLYYGSLVQYDPDNISQEPEDCNSSKEEGKLLKRTEYDLFGNISKEWDATGSDQSMTEYCYNFANQLIGFRDPQTRKYNNDTSNNYFSVKYSYDTLGRKISETKLKGFDGVADTSVKFNNGDSEEIYFVNTAYSYDYNGNLLKMWLKKGDSDAVDASNGGTLMLDDSYDFAGNLTMHKYAVAYNSANPSYEPLTNTTSYDYNALQKVKAVHKEIDANMKYGSGDTFDPEIITYDTSYKYDVMGNVVRKFDNMHKLNLYVYDKSGRLLSENKKSDNDANEKCIVTKAFYDRNGNKRAEVDGNGNIKEYVYDKLNRLIETKITVGDNLDQEDLDPENNDGMLSYHCTVYEYNDESSVISQTDKVVRGTQEASSVKKFEYDELNRLIKKADNNTDVEKIIYNSNNLQEYSFDANNHYTKYEYDDNGRLTRTIRQHSENNVHIQSQSYDFAGNIRAKTDGEGNITNYIYNEYDRLWYVISPKNKDDSSAVRQKTRYSYDLAGNMLQVDILNTNSATTETVFQGTSYAYTIAGQILRKTDNWGIYEEYKYDPDGSLRTKTFKNMACTVYDYDIHGNLENERTTKSGATDFIEISYEYDYNGNLTKVTDSSGQTIRTYDALNRVKTKDVSDIGAVYYYYDRIVKDQDDYMVAETSKDSQNNLTSKVYDKKGRLKYVIDGDFASETNQYLISQSTATKYEYYLDGSVHFVTYPSGAKEEYTYYYDGLLNTLTNTKPNATTIDSYIYTYDAAGNMSTKNESGRITSCAYDELNRLKTVTEQFNNNKKTTYSFDNAGNRSKEVIEHLGTTTVYEYNYSVYAKLTVTKKVATQQNPTQWITEKIEYNYDINGNQTIVNDVLGTQPILISSNEYDLLNRLVKTTNGNIVITNKYNGEDLRIEKSSEDINNQTVLTTKYLYEYDKVVLEVNSSGQETARNIYGTNLLLRQADGLSLYYMYNGHADVTALIDASTGNVRATYRYDAFGKIQDEKYYTASGQETTTPINNNIKYSGYQYDSETEVRDSNGNIIKTGLYYLNSRMYDPVTARFLQEDTYAGTADDPLSLNLYTYCSNNPLVYYDPTGHNKESLLDRFINWLTGKDDEDDDETKEKPDLSDWDTKRSTDEQIDRWDNVFGNKEEKEELKQSLKEDFDETVDNALSKPLKKVASIGVGFTPFDVVKDTADFLAEKDTFTEEPINKWVLGITIVLPEAGDQVVRQFAKKGPKTAAKNGLEELAQLGAKEYKYGVKQFIPDEIPGPNGKMISKEYDELVYGGTYSKKAYNRMRQNANWSNHGEKHLKATTFEKAEKLSYTNAQYLPGINNKSLEYEAMFKGIPITDDGNTIYYIYNTGKEIGYDRGVKTTWIRAELSSGVYHGHPMAPDRVQKYLSKFE